MPDGQARGGGRGSLAGMSSVRSWSQSSWGVGGLPRPGRLTARLGVVTGKKVGNAVARSRARRLMRESFRLHQRELSGPVDLVLVARPSIAGKKLADVERDFLRVLRQAGIEREEWEAL